MLSLLRLSALSLPGWGEVIVMTGGICFLDRRSESFLLVAGECKPRHLLVFSMESGFHQGMQYWMQGAK